MVSSGTAPWGAFQITDATPDDAEAVLAVKDASWREAYAHLLPAAFLTGSLGDSPARTEGWRRALGTGAGRPVVERVLSDRPASLWVFEDNPRARAFYGKLGFVPDGARHLEAVGGTSLYEIRMVRGAGGAA